MALEIPIDLPNEDEGLDAFQPLTDALDSLANVVDRNSNLLANQSLLIAKLNALEIPTSGALGGAGLGVSGRPKPIYETPIDRTNPDLDVALGITQPQPKIAPMPEVSIPQSIPSPKPEQAPQQDCCTIIQTSLDMFSGVIGKNSELTKKQNFLLNQLNQILNKQYRLSTSATGASVDNQKAIKESTKTQNDSAQEAEVLSASFNSVNKIIQGIAAFQDVLKILSGLQAFGAATQLATRGIRDIDRSIKMFFPKSKIPKYTGTVGEMPEVPESRTVPTIPKIEAGETISTEPEAKPAAQTIKQILVPAMQDAGKTMINTAATAEQLTNALNYLRIMIGDDTDIFSELNAELIKAKTAFIAMKEANANFENFDKGMSGANELLSDLEPQVQAGINALANFSDESEQASNLLADMFMHLRASGEDTKKAFDDTSDQLINLLKDISTSEDVGVMNQMQVVNLTELVKRMQFLNDNFVRASKEIDGLRQKASQTKDAFNDAYQSLTSMFTAGKVTKQSDIEKIRATPEKMKEIEQKASAISAQSPQSTQSPQAAPQQSIKQSASLLVNSMKSFTEGFKKSLSITKLGEGFTKLGSTLSGLRSSVSSFAGAASTAGSVVGNVFGAGLATNIISFGLELKNTLKIVSAFGRIFTVFGSIMGKIANAFLTPFATAAARTLNAIERFAAGFDLLALPAKRKQSQAGMVGELQSDLTPKIQEAIINPLKGLPALMREMAGFVELVDPATAEITNQLLKSMSAIIGTVLTPALQIFNTGLNGVLNDLVNSGIIQTLQLALAALAQTIVDAIGEVDFEVLITDLITFISDMIDNISGAVTAINSMASAVNTVAAIFEYVGNMIFNTVKLVISGLNLLYSFLISIPNMIANFFRSKDKQVENTTLSKAMDESVRIFDKAFGFKDTTAKEPTKRRDRSKDKYIPAEFPTIGQTSFRNIADVGREMQQRAFTASYSLEKLQMSVFAKLDQVLANPAASALVQAFMQERKNFIDPKYKYAR